MMWRQVLLLCCVALVAVSAYPQGPPTSACQDMVPQHETTAMDNDDSYFQIVTDSTCYNDGLAVEVRVRKVCDTPGHVEGVFIQARTTVGTVADNPQLGTFTVSDSILTAMTCTNAGDAVGHNDEKEADYRDMTWTAPTGDQGDIVIYGTVVHNKNTFWVGLTSDVLVYDSACVANVTVEDVTCTACHVTFPLFVTLAALLFYVIA